MHRGVTLFAVLLVPLACAVQEGPGPVPSHAWPAFRGPHGQGVAPTQDAPLTWNGKTGENVLWKVAVPGAGTNSPIVWGGRVFVSCGDESKLEVFGYEATTGKLLWRQEVKSTADKAPKLMDGTTYAAPTLATDGGHVFAIFATGDLAAFTMDGKKVWTVSLGLPKIDYGYTSSLMTGFGRVFVQFDQDKLGEPGAGRVLAFDAKTGGKIWEQKRAVEMAWSSPILANTGTRWELILNSEPLVTSLDPLTGRLLWSFKCMDGEVAPSPAWGGGVLFAVTDRAALVAIQPGDTPKKLWEYEQDLPPASSPVATDRHVFMASDSGTLSCLDVKTGKLAWRQESKEGIYGSLVLVGDRIYAMDRAGWTQVFRAGDRYENLAFNNLGEKGDCTPAFVEGRIFLRGEKHLFCIGKEAK